MAISIDHDIALKVLLAAFRGRCLKNDHISKKIKEIIDGTHKTYRYILVNGLLAKATNNSANPLALQAGASLNGAFDARSLCHKVLVPFEREFLYYALGGSNEPFLNKPARYPELSTKNAVRAGKDKKALESLINILSSIKSNTDAKEYLACAIFYVKNKIKKIQALNNSTISYNPTLVEVYEFIVNFCSKSHEGESPVLVVATLEKMYLAQLKDGYRVIPHKVNQSGASSKEVGDIDIYKGTKFIFAIEVKDKKFSQDDVIHAFDKMIHNSAQKGQFIHGTNSSYEEGRIRETLQMYTKRGFFTSFLGILEYSKIMLFKIENFDKKQFVRTLIVSAQDINAKEVTRKWIHDVLKIVEWK